MAGTWKTFAALGLLGSALAGAAASPLAVQGGEYATYLDTRNEIPFYRGYLVFHLDNGHDGVFMRNENLNTGNRLNYYVEFEYDADGRPKIASTNGYSRDAPPEFQQGLVDFLNFFSMYRANGGRDDPAVVEDPWENYALLYAFRPLTPLFRFTSIRKKGEERPVYVLEGSGIVSTEQIGQFFNRRPSTETEKPRPAGLLAIPPRPVTTADINGLKVALDENWHYSEAEGAPKGYWLSVSSIRDSQISMERIPADFLESRGLTPEELCRINVVGSRKVLYDTVYRSRTGDRLQVGYALLDERSQKNYQVFVIRRVGDTVLIVNFSTFADIFDANLTYYKAIVDGLAAQL